MSLIGTLDDTKIADVLRLFANGKKSGVLTVARPGHQASVRFQKGAIVQASAGRIQGDDAVLDLFGWREGQLTFVPAERTVTPNVTRGVDALILEGLRVGDTLHRMHELIPSDRVVFQMGTGPTDHGARLSVGPSEWRVLRLLDGVRDVRELVEASKLPRADVVKALFEMTEAGFLERIDAQKSLRVQPQGLFGKDAAELDEHLAGEWRKLLRFASGVHRIEVRSGTGRQVVLGAAFRAGLIRDVFLPRSVMTELGVDPGDEVFVRPVG